MEFFKPRIMTPELRLMTSLNARMTLSEEERQAFLNSVKGFEGECQFDQMVATQLNDRWLVLNDLLLKLGKSSFQIDSLLVSGTTMNIVDVKNFEGDYFIDENGVWRHVGSKREMKDPLLQLNRCESSLRQLLYQHRLKFTVKSHLLFINPEFTLYQVPVHHPIVLPTQVNRFFEKMKTITPERNPKNIAAAQLLSSLHTVDSPYERSPQYSYDGLKKGILCGCCSSFMLQINRSYMKCNNCRSLEKIDSAILRSVEEFQLLFPSMQIKTNAILDWCGGNVGSDKVIRRILCENYQMVGYGKNSYYIKKDK
ncbi:NERD domain-containing protein [Evansella sp. AB-rgal1]|uniref:NERD domain-containing protein n=1 Tax=Evansella sp. AB-rgal1 TaxID=3242696 RepID=UPI00359CBC1A